MAIDLNHGRAQGWPAIGSVMEALLLQAFQSDTRRIVLLDPDFTRWPLSSPALLGALQTWAGRGARKLEMAAPEWRLCERAHPRLLAWRKGFDHLLSIRQFDPQDAGADWPIALLAIQGGAALRLLEWHDGLAHWSHEGVERQALLEIFDAIAQRSSPGWPLTTVGL